MAQEQNTAVAAPAAPGTPDKKKKNRPKKHVVRKVIGLLIAAALIGLAVWGGIKLFGGEKDANDVMTAVVSVDSIVSKVSGEGLTRAKDSASLTLISGGTVQEVFVKEGDAVEAGQQLYRIRSDTARQAVTDAQRQVDNCMKELQKLEQARGHLTVTAPFEGKLLDVNAPKVGDDVNVGTRLATLVDDSYLTLVQYYSYAYADKISVGQSAQISIPASMTQIVGTVSQIHMVERISAEGTRLFEVDLTAPNPGTLTAGVQAGATLTFGGEAIYPYELGTFDYGQSAAIVTEAGGKAQNVDLRDYAKVKAGQTLLVMSGDENDTDIFNMNQQLQSARKTLDEAQNALSMLNGTAPISGTVMSVGARPGDEVKPGATMVVVSDYSTILVDAKVDERNVAMVKEGMTVDVDQWGTVCVGEVVSVGLNSTAENGVARFPVTISIDNSDGKIMPGSYATYTMIASQSDDCMILPVQAVKYAEIDGQTRTVVYVRSDERPDNAIDLETRVEGVPEQGYWAVPVSVGISDSRNVEILDGVEPGTEVFQQVIYSSEY